MAPPRLPPKPLPRICTECGTLTERFRGERNDCRDCETRKMRERWQADPEKRREISARAQRKARAEDPERVRANTRKAAASFRARHPEKAREDNAKWIASERSTAARRAKGAVQNAIKTGRLTRPTTCERCDATGLIEAAHSDYSRPLDVRWLCRRCHRQWDAAQPKTKKGN